MQMIGLRKMSMFFSATWLAIRPVASVPFLWSCAYACAALLCRGFALVLIASLTTNLLCSLIALFSRCLYLKNGSFIDWWSHVTNCNRIQQSDDSCIIRFFGSWAQRCTPFDADWLQWAHLFRLKRCSRFLNAFMTIKAIQGTIRLQQPYSSRFLHYIELVAYLAA